MNYGIGDVRRRKIGRYETTNAGGEPAGTLVPLPLPPDPPLELDARLQRALETATLALWRLDAVSTFLPSETIFRYAYVRREAVLSSRIEGPQSTLPDLLCFETRDAPGTPCEDIIEVSNHVAALDHGLLRLDEGFPLCTRLIREIHEVLLSRGRGSGKAPGEFRRSRIRTRGTRPGTARFVPRPPSTVPERMASLERFLHPDDGMPHLVRAGLAHALFETIHPFPDGDGRVGRLLIMLTLYNAGVLHQPLLYLSQNFQQRRNEYHDLFNHVRHTGDREQWLAFFLEGVRATAESGLTMSGRLVGVFTSDRAAIEQRAGRRAGSAQHVHEALKARPILSLSRVCERTRLSFPTAASAMHTLIELGIARELTGRPRNRLFAYDNSLSILSEGAEAR